MGFSTVRDSAFTSGRNPFSLIVLPGRDLFITVQFLTSVRPRDIRPSVPPAPRAEPVTLSGGKGLNACWPVMLYGFQMLRFAKNRPFRVTSAEWMALASMPGKRVVGLEGQEVVYHGKR